MREKGRLKSCKLNRSPDITGATYYAEIVRDCDGALLSVTRCPGGRAGSTSLCYRVNNADFGELEAILGEYNLNKAADPTVKKTTEADDSVMYLKVIYEKTMFLKNLNETAAENIMCFYRVKQFFEGIEATVCPMEYE